MAEISGMLVCQAFCSIRVLPHGFWIPCATVYVAGLCELSDVVGGVQLQAVFAANYRAHT